MSISEQLTYYTTKKYHIFGINRLINNIFLGKHRNITVLKSCFLKEVNT